MNKRLLAVLFSLLSTGVVLFAVATPAFAAPPPGPIPNSMNYDVGPALHHYCGSNWTNVGSDHYVPSNGSVHCNDAAWDDHLKTEGHQCDVYVFIPFDSGLFPNATVAYGLFDPSGQLLQTVKLNQGLYDNNWAYLTSASNIHHVYLADNDGQTGTLIGASTLQFTCF